MRPIAVASLFNIVFQTCLLAFSQLFLDPICLFVLILGVVVAIGREGLGFHRGHRQRACPGRPPSGIGRVERSNLMRASLHPKLQTRCSGETVRIIRLET
jgi:hypothetical protein